MHKRIEFIVRNPGMEGTSEALRAITIDFEGETEFKFALGTIAEKLFFSSSHPLILVNEKGKQIGLHPQHYVSHYVGDADDWEDTWVLPSTGAAPPTREE